MKEYRISKDNMNACRSLSNQEFPTVQQVPNVVLAPDIQYIDEDGLPSDSKSTKIHRGDKTHSSLRIARKPSSRRRVCRHHSDSEARNVTTSTKKPSKTNHKPRSKRIRRSVSDIETSKSSYRPHIRRSISDRSSLIIVGKHLAPPRPRLRPHSMSDTHSSRCSSTKTLSSNVSISEIVAVEMGLKDIPGLTPKEARRRRVVFTVMVVSVTILVLSVVLIALTLLLSPAVDAI
ncbi:hypothetical protein X975_08795, partial [Stegodyphus mimosarum]